VDSQSPWLNYEIGVAVGRGLLPIVLVSGSTTYSAIRQPIASIFLVNTGDGNRLGRHFTESGFSPKSGKRWPEALHDDFAPFFLQVDEGVADEQRHNRKRRPRPVDLTELDARPK
jgi:hypothetical protein